MKTFERVRLDKDLLIAAKALERLERLVATVKGKGPGDPSFSSALVVLEGLSHKEGIPIAIIGGMAAIYHGYERYTKDIDVVVATGHLDSLVRVAPNYGVKVLWRDPRGWHKFQYEGVQIEVIPEGGKPNKEAPTRIPGPKQLGISQGMGYANLEGWTETKLGSGRRQDQADVVQVLKKTEPAAINKIRQHIASVHAIYLRLFDELAVAAEEEKVQEVERGGPR
jgi:hypothetical protein